MEIDDNKILGVLCQNGHEYKNTGKSLRYKKPNGEPKDCIKCMRLYHETHEFEKKCPYKASRSTRKREARAYAAINCIHYEKCLNLAAHGEWGGNEMPCLNCERMEVEKDYYLREVESTCLSRDASTGHVLRLPVE